MDVRSDEGTAAEQIRDAAMRLFAERGAAQVTVRDIAASAGVSPALVIHHYRSKAGLKSVVDAHAGELLARALAAGDGAVRPEPQSPLANAVAAHPDLLPYLRRMLVDGGPPADELFRTLLARTGADLDALARGGSLLPAEDPAARAAFLLVADLGVLILREQVHAVLGSDPFAGPGVVRWREAVADVYRGVYSERAYDT
jgi:AcrR family transcriptional regulator